MYEPNLRRILRYAILYHRVFQEPRAGFVTHSAASRLLVMDPAMFDTLGMMYDESWQAFARVRSPPCVCTVEICEERYGLCSNNGVWFRLVMLCYDSKTRSPMRR